MTSKDNFRTIRPESDPYSWSWIFISTCDSLKPSILIYIRKMNLEAYCSYDELVNESFLRLDGYYNKRKLFYEEEENIFIYTKENGDKTIITNFKGWLRVVFCNHLKGVRTALNSPLAVGKTLNLENYEYLHDESFKNSLEKMELKDKLEELKDIRDRKILDFFYLQDMTYKTIAQVFRDEGLGIYDETTLRQRKKRAIGKLKRLYDENC